MLDKAAKSLLSQVEWYIGRLTDLSQAIEYADAMLLTAPFPGDRAVINIVGNGKDNVGEDPMQSRDRVVARGGTINGLVLGNDPEMFGYYRDSVIGGLTSFVMSVSGNSTMTDAMVRKLIADIVAQAPNPPAHRSSTASGL